jgi:gas vesicle protein
MSQTPDEIRADIERTRLELGTDVDAIADKVSPANIAHRQTEKVKNSFSSVKETVMGKAEDVKDAVIGKAGDVKESVQDKAGHAKNKTGSGMNSGLDSARSATGTVKDSFGQAGHAVQNAPQQLSNKAAGNPLAAGLIAFGAGLLVSSLIPASQKEQQAAAQLKDQVAPLKEKVTEAAKQVVEEVKAPAQEAVQSVKESATESVQTVKEEGQQAASDVKGSAQDAKSTVQNN